jgi:hypothetical protein
MLHLTLSDGAVIEATRNQALMLLADDERMLARGFPHMVMVVAIDGCPVQ